ncbi:mechanosensitive ion channel family protein [Solibacillus sp. FSL K6-1523]|uniref:mechanosensitive ion channel family protein n=1 Tax=Solibacillus sp. FSL K6-1523 TaxID=2921471 RepID=UPI0030F7EE44
MDSIKWFIPNVEAPTWTDALAATVIVVVGLVIIFLVIRPIVMKTATFLEKKQHPVLSDISKYTFPAFRNALIFTLVLTALSLLFEVWLFDAPKMQRLIKSVYIYFVFKALYDILSFYLRNPARFETDENQDILTPFFLRISKVIIMIIAMFSIASVWSFNLEGFLTALGLTGVALAFGIRDTLAHIFGGMSVALDKPFQIGDWIMTADGKIDGTIEDINLRSTVIQTSDQGLVYVPNSFLVNRPIYNLSKREQRKIEHYLFVSNENNEENIVNFMASLHEQIAMHPKTLKNIIHVAMDELRPSSCRIIIRYFANTNDTAEMLRIKQDILFAAMHSMERFEIQLVETRQEQFVWNDTN